MVAHGMKARRQASHNKRRSKFCIADENCELGNGKKENRIGNALHYVHTESGLRTVERELRILRAVSSERQQTVFVYVYI